MAASRRPLPDARWHFSHGPIDIVIGADGEVEAVRAAHERAWQRFEPLLDELVAELPLMRAPVDPDGRNPLRGAVARRMWQACVPFAGRFITPMAAVAGAVAQELVAAYRVPGVQRAWVNDGGDIALHLVEGASVSIGLYADLACFDAAAAAQAARGRLPHDSSFVVRAGDGVAGVATSGWRGRSHSLGIADSVTVLAADAASADAAATMIANEVDVEAPGIVRRPACELRDDSDLGTRLVTVDVPALPAEHVNAALEHGEAMARECRARGLIVAAMLVCQRQARWVEPLPRRREPGLASTLLETAAP